MSYKIKVCYEEELTNISNSTPFKDFYSINFCRMAFRKLLYEWPLPVYTRPVRLEWIHCWYDEEEIYVDIFSRDTYRKDYITISDFPENLDLDNIIWFFTRRSQKKVPRETRGSRIPTSGQSRGVYVRLRTTKADETVKKVISLFVSLLCFSLDIYCWWTESGGRGVLTF